MTGTYDLSQHPDGCLCEHCQNNEVEEEWQDRRTGRTRAIRHRPAAATFDGYDDE